MRILGIDPGLGRVGWGVIEVEHGKCLPLAYDCFETKAHTPTAERLVLIYDKAKSLIGEYKPTSLAIEELFFNRNVTTAMSVGEARGVVLLAAAQKGVEIAVYPPLQVKLAVAGYGRADKRQIGEMVKLILKLKAVPRPDDTADALAVAITHAGSLKLKA